MEVNSETDFVAKNEQFQDFVKAVAEQAASTDAKDVDALLNEKWILDQSKTVQEAHALGIPLIGISDTNCDPEELDFVIPGNDDAIRAVKLIVSTMADAVVEANQGLEEIAARQEAEAAGEEAYEESDEGAKEE